jgi:hypothetical protein
VKRAATPNLWLANPGFNDVSGVYVDSSSGPATDSSMAGWDVTFTYTSVSNSIYTDGPPGAVPQEGPLALFVSALRPDPAQGSPSNTTYLETAVANRAAVKPGRTYNFSFAESNPASNVLAGVKWYNATGGVVRQDLFVPSVSVYYGEWQIFTRITNAPAGALWAGAYFTMGQGYTGIDRFQLWAYPDGTNVNPFVSAGPDQKIGLGTVTQLGGAAADADGDPLTTQWSFISGPGTVTFSSTNVLNPWVAFTTNAPGTYVLRLTVNDGQGHIVTDDVNISPSLFTGEKILIFAGQSNMEGNGTPNSLTNLTAQDRQVMSNVFGFYSHATDTDGTSAACPPTGPDLGGTPDPYGLYIYVGFGGSGTGCPYNEKTWMTARTTNGVTYDGGTWLPGYGQPKEGSAQRGVYIAGGSWQPYQIWKSDYVGWTRKGPVLFNKSASFWYMGLNPGETWANATSFSTGEPMQEFGPEFTAIKTITAAYPTNIFNIVKYAPGGTDLANDWNPNASQGCYSGLVSWVRAAMLQKPGAEIVGFFWLQGESDAISLGIAPQYYQNLTNMLARLRADLETPNLPVVIAKISSGNPKDDLQNPAEWPNFTNQGQWTNSNYGIYYAGTTMGIHQVRSAQQAAADNDPLRVKAIETADLPYLSHQWITARTIDNSLTRAPAVAGVHWNVITNQGYSPLHYSDAGIKTIGTRMGQAWLQLITNSAPPPVTGYDAWATGITNGLTNYNESATGDGYPNLLKYATGSSPTGSDTLAHMGGMTTGGLFGITFNRNTNATDVTMIVEGSSSLLNGSAWDGLTTNKNGMWNPTNIVTESGVGSPVNVVIREPMIPTNRYLRLRVTRP